MKNFSRLLQDIKDNPVMYLGKPSITCLHSFLIGYIGTLNQLGLSWAGSEMDGFQEWIQEREKTTLTQSWAGILLFVCGNDKRAFSAFFELFEKFLNNKSSQSKKNELGDNLKSNWDDNQPNTCDLYELLGRIKKRPGMFLGTSSITRLDMYLRGYSLARREVGIPPTEQEREFEGFQPWIEEKYGIKSGQSWAKIILFFCVDEPEALTKFFELYEEYQN